MKFRDLAEMITGPVHEARIDMGLGDLFMDIQEISGDFEKDQLLEAIAEYRKLVKAAMPKLGSEFEAERFNYSQAKELEIREENIRKFANQVNFMLLEELKRREQQGLQHFSRLLEMMRDSLRSKIFSVIKMTQLDEVAYDQRTPSNPPAASKGRKPTRRVQSLRSQLARESELRRQRLQSTPYAPWHKLGDLHYADSTKKQTEALEERGNGHVDASLTPPPNPQPIPQTISPVRSTGVVGRADYKPREIEELEKRLREKGLIK